MKIKYIILSILLLFVSNSIFAQTNYTNGFNTGYKKGYCQDQGIGCIDPIPPIAPIPKIGESFESYSDGYNRGFKMGLSANSSTNSSKSSGYRPAKAKLMDGGIYSNTDDVALKIKVLKKITNRALKNLENGNYERVIDDANYMLKIHPTYAIAYVYKSSAQYHLGQVLNAYNNSVKAVRVYSRSDIREWKDFMYKEMEEHLKSLMSKNRFDDVIYITENFWYKSNLGNYYRGFGYYFKHDYKKAKKYLKKVKNNKTVDKYLLSIKNKNYYINPF